MERFTVPKICQQFLTISFSVESNCPVYVIQIVGFKIAKSSSIAASRVQYAGPQKGRRGQLRSVEAEIALSTSFLRKTLSVCAVRGQARVLLGRLDVMGPGAAAAAMRRNNALLLERRWAQQRRADCLSNLLGKTLLRRGHFKIDQVVI